MLVRCIALSLDRFESQSDDIKGEDQYPLHLDVIDDTPIYVIPTYFFSNSSFCVYFSSTVAEVLSECRLLSYMTQGSIRMSFLFRLITIIHVQTLTQVSSRWPTALYQKGDPNNPCAILYIVHILDGFLFMFDGL